MTRIEKLHIMSRAKLSLLTQILKERKSVDDLGEYIENLWETEIDNLKTIEEIKKNKKGGKYYDFE